MMIKSIFPLFIGSIKKMFNLKGRSGKKEYITFTFFEFLIFTPYAIWFKYYSENPSTINVILLIAFFILIFIYIISYYSLTVRRLHDCGLSGWWYILNFIFSPFIFLILCFIKGDKNKNKYGAPPEE